MSIAMRVDWVAVADLHPDPRSPRIIDPEQLDALTVSIARYGFTVPIVAHHDSGVIVDGHQRLRAAARLGHTHVPVYRVDFPDAVARALGLAINQIGGTWDEQLLGRILAELRLDLTVDLATTGFGTDEIGRLIANLDARDRATREDSFDLEAALALHRGTRTAPGEVWIAGDHRLLVGDSTDGGLLDRLLVGERPALTVTDPPYGVAYGSHGGQQRGARRRSIKNDALDPVAHAAFVESWTTMLVERAAGAIYVCMSSQAWPQVAAALEAAGGHWSDTLIWRKDRFVLGRADYQRGYEPIWYGWPEGARRQWCGDRDQSDVWEIDRPSASPLHPMTKPLELIERAIRNSSRPGDLVFDPFGGSGTTLIAAERTGRRCAMVELDPRYGDVVLARYEAFSGATATRLE